MLDTFYALKGQLRRPGFDPRYEPDQSIIRATLTEAADAATLTVVFPFWHAPRQFTDQLEQKLQARGTSVLLYELNPLMLTNDIDKVRGSFEFVAESIAQDIRNLRRGRRFKTVKLLGFSLGVVSLFVVAEQLKDFDEVTLVVPGNDLAASLWHGRRTKRLRNSIRQRGYGLAELQEAWRAITPEAHVKALSNHKITIILAKHDRFIPYHFGQKLHEQLRAVSPDVTCRTTPYGHVATIWRFLQTT